ncbi:MULTISPECIES: hypothetical protein [Leptospira]|uniref:Bacterial Pleckstrin homology domain-containing protein n=2 Tax=Leptospira weilii TaxID=28184 RepID=A0A828Z2V8_9LEPT|nr:MULTISPECIES: hypothetical protein [Leptospira]EKR64284.1 hypothetical protein LEP1GSC036_3643 [Leptospira weilii str. 2006001853]EMJ64458.1 hypothetical protein LEP1GSC051_2748 [Leptospira sp. P2653]EMN44392.1 hypothetical protein LEP1GSC086_2859 [Leptospira weilii str. LNT 1234]EMN91104.1 hypothetical protein LEP1GSC108_0085 [Leptospira weilii str. UI 13098]MCL8268663.1 hypothetical protein [Leptospira weilii]
MKEITLLTDEKKVFELEADFWNRGNNLIQRALGNTFRIIAKFFGTRIHGKLIITNLRALEVKETIQWYCIPTKREVKLLTKNSIKEIGYEMDKVCLVFCPTYYLYYEAHTQSTTIAVQNGSDEQMLDLLAKFYNVIE